jgi:hypothetical protein
MIDEQVVDQRLDSLTLASMQHSEAIARIGGEVRAMEGRLMMVVDDVRNMEKEGAIADEKARNTAATVHEIKALGATLSSQLQTIMLRIEQMSRNWQTQMMTLLVAAVTVVLLTAWQWVSKV